MIIERYVLREIVGTFAAVLAVLLLIYGSNRFALFLTDAAAGLLSGELIFELLMLKLVENLAILLPLAFYIAVLLGLGRLYKDSEIVAMSAAGVGVRRIAQGVFWCACGFALVGAGLSLVVSPTVANWQEALLQEAKEKAETTALLPGRFKEFGEGDQVIYVESMSADRRRMQNVFVQVRRRGQQYLLVSEAAYQTVHPNDGGRFMVLENGYRYSGNPGTADFSITRFERHAVRLEQGPTRSVYRKREMLPTLDLLRSDAAADISELQGRISRALSVVFLALLAVPLARTSPRQGRYAKLFVAMLVFFLYNNGVSIAQKLVERGDLSPWIGVWPVHAAVGLAAAGLIFAQASGRLRLSTYLRPSRGSDDAEEGEP